MLAEILIPIFGMISTFGSIAFILYLFLSTRHKERMALIEKGADASIFQRDRASNKFTALKYGLTMIFGGLGILLGFLISSLLGLIEEYLTFTVIGMVLLFAGIGLFIYYRIVSKKNSN